MDHTDQDGEDGGYARGSLQWVYVKWTLEKDGISFSADQVKVGTDRQWQPSCNKLCDLIRLSTISPSRSHYDSLPWQAVLEKSQEACQAEDLVDAILA